MPAKDKFHEIVRKALENEGWNITDDPFHIQFGGVDLYVDLAAERGVIAAEKNGRKIAVEVKSFIGPSLISEFHMALGQFIDYRIALQAREPDRVLYLAIPIDTYQTFFNLPFTKTVVESLQLKLIVYDAVQEVIVKWQE